MSVLFSAVTLTAGDKQTKFFVGGVPRVCNDLSGYIAYENFTDGITEQTEAKAHIESYLYGEGEMVDASIEEITYFMKRIEMNPNFIADRCDIVASFEFIFLSLPNDGYELEVKQYELF